MSGFASTTKQLARPLCPAPPGAPTQGFALCARIAEDNTTSSFAADAQPRTSALSFISSTLTCFSCPWMSGSGPRAAILTVQQMKVLELWVFSGVCSPLARYDLRGSVHGSLVCDRQNLLIAHNTAL